MGKRENLKQRISHLNKQQLDISEKLKSAYNECTHSFEHGYTLEPVIYCTICGRDATDIFPNMSYEHIEKLMK